MHLAVHFSKNFARVASNLLIFVSELLFFALLPVKYEDVKCLFCDELTGTEPQKYTHTSSPPLIQNYFYVRILISNFFYVSEFRRDLSDNLHEGFCADPDPPGFETISGIGSGYGSKSQLMSKPDPYQGKKNFGSILLTDILLKGSVQRKLGESKVLPTDRYSLKTVALPFFSNLKEQNLLVFKDTFDSKYC